MFFWLIFLPALVIIAEYEKYRDRKNERKKVLSGDRAD